MYSFTFSRFFSSAKRLFSTISAPGQGWEFFQSSLHKDNMKFTGAIMAIGGLLAEGAFVSYKVLENTKDIHSLEKKMATDIQSLEKKMATDIKECTKEISEDIKALRNDMIIAMGFAFMRQIPDHISDAIVKSNRSVETPDEDKKEDKDKDRS